MSEDPDAFNPTLKKKKKKKPFDPDAIESAEIPAPPQPTSGAGEDVNTQEDKTTKVDIEAKDEFDLTTKKKKKKKKPLESSEAPPSQEQEITPEVNEGEEDTPDFSLTKKKKKKPFTDSSVASKGLDDVDSADVGDSNQTDNDYTYEELLSRVFAIMLEKNPDMVVGEKKKFIMKPPQVVRVGTKKTSFSNFAEICKLLHRQPKHLLAYLLAELGTSGSLDGQSQLIIKGRFQQKQIETVLRTYIKEYVTCHTCKSPETILQKDTRLYFLQCEACGSRCSVATIKSGFQAVTGKRAAIRARNA